jgi:predicted small secreted protein
MKRLVVCLLFVLAVSLLSGCDRPEGVPRDSTGDYDGSARWAYDLTQSERVGLPADAALFMISGITVGMDGRLASNTGQWQFTLASFSTNLDYKITVKYDGSVTSKTEEISGLWGDSRPPIPNGWLNSTDIFEVICPGCGQTSFIETALNLADPSYGGGEPVWSFGEWIPAGTGYDLVKWDGTLIPYP